jgi:multidrug resistance protein
MAAQLSSMGIMRFLEPLAQEKRLAPLLVMIACIMMGSGLVAPILSLYAQTFGVAGTLVGTLVTMFGIGRLVANLPSGYLSQRYGRRPLLMGGPLIVAAASVGAALAVDFTSLLVWRFLQGVGSGVYLTASLAAMADISPPNRRAMNMALYQSSLQLGASFGPAVGGFAAHYFGFASVFWFYAGVALLASVTAVHSFEDTLDKTQARQPLPSAISRRGLMTAPFTAVCLLSCVVFFTRTATLFQLVPFLGAESFGLDVGTIGVAITVFAFMNFAMLPITTPLIEKFGARANVLWSTLATAVGLAVLYLSSAQIGFWLAVVMLGAATGVNYPAISTFTIAALPRERFGPGMGMQRTFGDVGFVIGPVIVGALSDFTGGGHGAGVALNIVLLGAAALAFAIGSRGMRAELR